MQKNIFLATHPAFNQLTKITSTFGSVARTALTISNALNLMMLRQQGTSSALATAQHELNEAQRDYNQAIRDFGPDSREAADAFERIGIASARVKELMDTDFFNGIQSFFTTIAAIVTGLSSGVALLPKILPVLDKLSAIRLAPGLAGALATPFVQIPALALAAGFAISEMLRMTNEEFRIWQDGVKEVLDNFFLVQIPMAIGEAALFLGDFFVNQLPFLAETGWTAVKDVFIKVWNSIAKSLESGINFMIKAFQNFVNRIVSAINKIIKGLNKLPGVSIGTIAPINLSGISIPLIAAAKGFNGQVSQPTMFLAGEAGAEHVSITPNGSSSSGGGLTVLVNVRGSIITEKELFRKFDDHFKTELKKRNFIPNI